MANSKQAKKRIRQIERRTEVNRYRITRLRTYIKKVEVAIASGDQTVAQAAFKEAQPVMQKSVTKGIIHANTISRKLSRLNRAIKGLAA